MADPLTPATGDASNAVVVASWDETPLLRGLRLRLVGEDTRLESYRQAGQYVKVATTGGEGMFALASAPGQPFELVIKRGTPLADALSLLPVGAGLSVSAAQGAGFPMAEARGKDVLLFAMGSGIAPIRAALRSIAAERAAYGKVTLFEGQRHGHHFAFPSDRASWVAQDMKLIEVASQPAEGWAGRKGYVQAALDEVRPEVGNAVAFLCGKKPMVEAVRAALTTLGLPAGRSFLNY